MTHADLVRRAGRWLRNQFNCGVVFEELSSVCPETPDAIGWCGQKSILVECKTSRADFRADHKKWHRSHGSDKALGMWRFYLSLPDAIPPDEVPAGWGLYEIHGRSIQHKAGERYANAATPPFESYIRREKMLLLSAIRRLQISSCVYVREVPQQNEEGR